VPALPYNFKCIFYTVVKIYSQVFEAMWLYVGERILTISLAILTQYRGMTDGQTDERTYEHKCYINIVLAYTKCKHAIKIENHCKPATQISETV